ncbi:putative quinol monooxygenase [Cognatishimia maritima]|uniref:Quinol monooxygenase YgiN n=1 Tax=Cognatishimia maritima TaxID=870908 RepID=A0A1M5I8S8_9RHOB|nr:antibiotic biosynthesis monooxygenase [Cognatishimia maritima]SHG24290.1 Quinol monooxygenase YgiN [Cognatishimia maritima]
MIQLTGYIDIPEDRFATVIAALPEHIKRTRQEPGNVAFEVKQSESVPFRLEVDETFMNLDAFKRHQDRTALSHWAEITRDIPRKFKMEELI